MSKEAKEIIERAKNTLYKHSQWFTEGDKTVFYAADYFSKATDFYLDFSTRVLNIGEFEKEYMWFKVEEDKPEFIKFEDWEDGVWYCANGCNREKENFAYKIENNIIYIKILDDTDPPLIRSSISYNELHDIDWIKWEGK